MEYIFWGHTTNYKVADLDSISDCLIPEYVLSTIPLHYLLIFLFSFLCLHALCMLSTSNFHPYAQIFYFMKPLFFQ